MSLLQSLGYRVEPITDDSSSSNELSRTRGSAPPTQNEAHMWRSLFMLSAALTTALLIMDLCWVPVFGSDSHSLHNHANNPFGDIPLSGSTFTHTHTPIQKRTTCVAEVLVGRVTGHSSTGVGWGPIYPYCSSVPAAVQCQYEHAGGSE